MLLCKIHVTLYYLLFYVVYIVRNKFVLSYVTQSTAVENNASIFKKNIYYFCPYACIIKMNKLCSDENIRVWHFFTTNKVLAVTWEHSGEQQVWFICIYSQWRVNNLHILPSIVSNHQNVREWNTRNKTTSLNTTKLPKY